MNTKIICFFVIAALTNSRTCANSAESATNDRLQTEESRKTEIALSACLGSSSGGHDVVAVKRTFCDGQNDGTCNHVCRRQNHSLRCVNAVSVHNRDSASYASGHKYNMAGCSFLGCGPNYCCCQY